MTLSAKHRAHLSGFRCNPGTEAGCKLTVADRQPRRARKHDTPSAAPATAAREGKAAVRGRTWPPKAPAQRRSIQKANPTPQKGRRRGHFAKFADLGG